MTFINLLYAKSIFRTNKEIILFSYAYYIIAMLIIIRQQFWISGNGKNIKETMLKHFNKTEIGIVILRSFYLDQRWSINGVAYPSNDKKNAAEQWTTVTLLNMEIIHFESIKNNIRCAHNSAAGDDKWWNGGMTKTWPAQIAYLIGGGAGQYQCQIAQYAVFCHGKSNKPDFSRQPQLNVQLGFFYNFDTKRQTGIKTAHLAMSTVIPPPPRRDLVFCLSRMFFFKNFQLLTLAMELYRLQGVNLIAAYVLSVDSAIFRLMQLYERDGILTFRHNLEMPEQVHGIGYNPNLETEWVNQVIDFNDCFYEFRSRTTFVTFVDWDDIILSNDLGSRPLPQIFNEKANILEKVNKTGMFLLQIQDGFIRQKVIKPINRASVGEFLKFGVAQDLDHLIHKLPHAKAVAFGKYTEALWIHGAQRMENEYKEELFPFTEVFGSHLRHRYQNATPENANMSSNIPAGHRQFNFHSELLEINWNTFLNRYLNESEEILQKLPPEVENSQNQGESGYRAVLNRITANSIHRCGSYELLREKHPKRLPYQNKCYNSQNRWLLYQNDHRNGISVTVLQSQIFELNDWCFAY